MTRINEQILPFWLDLSEIRRKIREQRRQLNLRCEDVAVLFTLVGWRRVFVEVGEMEVSASIDTLIDRVRRREVRLTIADLKKFQASLIAEATSIWFPSETIRRSPPKFWR